MHRRFHIYCGFKDAWMLSHKYVHSHHRELHNRCEKRERNSKQRKISFHLTSLLCTSSKAV
uniref:Uncharacterized protein n=1 Tax=Parascaris univalens TaxID=6257 RepID=A0A915C3Z8_PARUN